MKYAIQITMEDNISPSPIKTYYRHRGINLSDVKVTQDFTSLGAKPTTYHDPENASRKCQLVADTCKRLKLQLKQQGIQRQFKVEVIPYPG